MCPSCVIHLLACFLFAVDVHTYIYLCAVQLYGHCHVKLIAFKSVYLCILHMCVYVSPDKQFNTAVVVQPQSLGLCTICNFKNVSVVLSGFYKHFSESVISTSHPMRKLHIFQ